MTVEWQKDPVLDHALRAFQAREYVEALKGFNTLLTSDPEVSKYYIFRGLILKELGRYEDSASDFKRHTEMCPENAVSSKLLFVSLGYLGRFQDALAEATRFRDIFRDIECPESKFKPKLLAVSKDWLKMVDSFVEKGELQVLAAQKWHEQHGADGLLALRGELEQLDHQAGEI